LPISIVALLHFEHCHISSHKPETAIHSGPGKDSVIRI
jgi:hypothetical protein